MAPTAARAHPGPGRAGSLRRCSTRLQVRRDVRGDSARLGRCPPPPRACSRCASPAPWPSSRGCCLWLAFPDHNVWPLAPVGVALFAVAVRGQRARRGAWLGFVTGLAYFVPLLHWSGVYVGTLPWMALSVLQALYVALLGLAAPGRVAAAGVAPLAIAGLWVAQEALRDRTPYGGFPWARLAFSQADAPTLHLAALGGAPLVTFAVALAGAAPGRGWSLPVARPGSPADGAGPRRSAVAAAAAALGGVAVMAVGLLVPLPTGGRTIQVAGVQGDVPEAGLDFDAQRRAVLDNCTPRATAELAAQVAAGHAAAARRRHLAGERLRPRPLPAGRRPRGHRPGGRRDRGPDAGRAPSWTARRARLSNVSIVWTPGSGPGAQYVKRHPVPFGEYIPSRRLLPALQQQGRPGRPGLRGRRQGRASCSSGRPRSAWRSASRSPTTTCVRDTVDRGADLLVVQTNNATFGYTDEAAQQLAMSRLRAVEHGRAVAHISTVGDQRPDRAGRPRSSSRASCSPRRCSRPPCRCAPRSRWPTASARGPRSLLVGCSGLVGLAAGVADRASPPG